MTVNRINSHMGFLKYIFLLLYLYGAQLTAQILVNEEQLLTTCPTGKEQMMRILLKDVF